MFHSLRRSSSLICIAIVFAACLTGCGPSEPSVVMPTEEYQPTEVEQENAEREAIEREQEN